MVWLVDTGCMSVCCYGMVPSAKGGYILGFELIDSSRMLDGEACVPVLFCA